ncbi:probable protein disulfide-isomerase A4 [Schistocerca gregaria]|uniref:probable protein disulfide-isomerase A4 n=1 Tax=Schistocerca gregaria TaxID=7010 RepID=UPI00211EBD9E|nr:probable protein disulfide-isomerase A4 [Schistocerca gregaria]
MKYHISSLLVILIVSLNLYINGIKCEQDETDIVPNLRADEFNSLLKEKEYVLADFYAPWCSHCKKLNPVYSQLYEDMKNRANLAIVKINTVIEKDLNNQYDIKGYPTIILFRNGEVCIEYNGERNVNSMKKWLVDIVDKNVSFIQQESEFENFMNTASSVHLVFVGSDEKYLDTFKAHCLSCKLVDGDCAYTDSTNVSKNLDKDNATFFFDKYSVHRYPHGESDTLENYRKWLDEYSQPTLQKFVLEPEFVQSLVSKNKPIVIYFHKDPNDLQIIINISEKLKDLAIFTEAKADSLGPDFPKNWGASGNVYPSIILVIMKEENQNPSFLNWDESVELTEETGGDWLKKCIVDNECVIWKKSAPIPDVDVGPVKTIVYDNFNEIMEDDNVSIFIKYYVPWCEHCKKLEPVFKELAERLSGVSDKLVLGEYNCNENYVDLSFVNRYPMLALYKRGDKSNPIVYEGEPTLDKMYEWLLSRVGDVSENKDEL